MARVYDARLAGPSGFSRRLAVKVMRPLPGKREQLQQAIVSEARIAGLLHHPSIVSVHDFGIEEEQPFVAMEWVDGLDLHRLLQEGGALPPSAILDVGIALADALHYAHTLEGPAGPLRVVHRDLKPSNVLIGRRGEVKLMDFGLARAEGVERASSATGIAKGSVPWMSPEQALAQPLDGRSDIFALGTVLYEMALGRRFSSQPSVPSIVADLLSVEDRIQVGGALDALDLVAPGLTVLVRRCLRRDPDDRFTSADLLADDLRRLRRDVSEVSSLAECVRRVIEAPSSVDPNTKASNSHGMSTTLELASGLPQPPAHDRGVATAAVETTQIFEAEASVTDTLDLSGAASRSRPLRRAIYLAAIVVIALAVARYVPDVPLDGSVTNARPPDSTSLTQLSPGASPEGEPALSPDGSRLAFIRLIKPDANPGGALERALFLRDLSTGTESRFDTQDLLSIHHPTWAPDGASIVATAMAPVPGIYRFPLDGSKPEQLSEQGFHAALSPDGRHLAYVEDNTNSPRRKLKASPLWRVDLQTLEKTMVVTGDANDPSWSPDGSKIAYYAVELDGTRDVWTVSSSGGEPTRVTRSESLDWSPVWAADGRHLFFLSNRTGLVELHRVAVDDGAPRGVPELVRSLPSGAQVLSIDGTGRRLVFERHDYEENIQYLLIEHGEPVGEARWLTEGSRRVHSSHVSPRGDQVVWSEEVGHEDLWVASLDGSPRRLTNDHFLDRYPRWLDDDQVVFVSNRGGEPALWVWSVSSGRLSPLPSGDELTFFAVSADGRIAAVHAGTESLVLLDGAGGRRRALLDLPGAGRMYPSSWSPDGRLLLSGIREHDHISWAAVFEPDSGKHHLVSPFPYNFARWLDDERVIGLRSGREVVRLRWPDGAPEVLYEAPQGASLRWLGLSVDRRHLTVQVIDTKFGIWMLEFTQADP